MSQDESRKFCEKFNSHLVEINSEEENTAILAEIGQQGFHSRNIEFWLGITDRHSEGNWVLESTGESLPFSKWETFQPDDGGEGEDCAHLGSTGKWNDRFCEVEMQHWNGNDYIYTALCEI